MQAAAARWDQQGEKRKRKEFSLTQIAYGKDLTSLIDEIEAIERPAVESVAAKRPRVQTYSRHSCRGRMPEHNVGLSLSGNIVHH